MDERIRQTYHKIYAELFHIVLFGCCISVVVKLAFLGMNATDCIPEYPILVGTPIYLAVRTRMLGVTQMPTSRTKNRKLLPLVCGALTALFVFVAVMRGQGEAVDIRGGMIFLIPFLAMFLLVQTGFRKLEERRQKKLDSKYDD